MNEDKILLSVIIPCRNEEKYIEKCLDSLIEQDDVDFKYEILVVDGMSNDRTREIINSKSAYKDIVKVLDNPHKITPFAMNIGINYSRGNIVTICGAHSVYDKRFLKSGTELFSKVPEAIATGGPIESVSDTEFGKAVSLAMASPIGVGNAKHRFPNYEGFAEMACFPFYKKEAFEKVGLFDEHFVRNQDDEFSFRLRLRGEKVYISPKVKSFYFVRSSPKKLFKQYFQYGYWRYFVLKKHKKQISFRQLIPSLFLLSLLLSVLGGIYFSSLLMFLAIPTIYLFSIFIASISKIKKYGIKIGIYYIFSVIILHVSYGLGLIWAVIKGIFTKKKILE